MNWPLYKSEILLIGNPLSQVGILTLFTQKEQVAKHLSKDDYALLGQLYNPSQGLSILLRNCLANKNLRYLIVIGQDLSGSGEALLKLSQDGVEELWENNQVQNNPAQGCLTGYLIKNLAEKRIIEKEISLKAIELFRKNVQVLDYRHLKDFQQLNIIIHSLVPLPGYGEPEYFPEPELNVTTFSTDPSLFQIKSKTVSEAWLKILDTVMRFGIIKKSEYAEDQKEVLNLAAVITAENPENIQWEEYFPFTKEHLQEYLPRVITNQNVEGVNYTYGNRLRSWRGIDQIESLIKRLKESLHTRRAVAVTWDVEKDHSDSEAPCLDLIQCLVQNNMLYMTAFFRSNDMFAAWPENALALRKLQGLISAELGTALGSLTTLAGSAHIYQGSWNKAADILNKNKIKIEQLNDPRGNFVIYLQRDLIHLEHQSPEGTVLEKITGKTAQELSYLLVQKQKISDYYHALYLGRELQKAELALQNNLNYEQERNIMEDKSTKTPKKGRLIVVDGIDGVGKSVFINTFIEEAKKDGKKIFDVHKFWQNNPFHPSPQEIINNFDVAITSEPTFVGTGKLIREELIAKNQRDYSPSSVAEAYALDRRILYEQLLIPLLEAGIDVYQSRSFSTSIVYQQQNALDLGQKLSVKDILAIPGNKFCYEHPISFLVILTIVDVQEAIRRSQQREKDDNCEFENLDFQLKIKKHFESPEFQHIFEQKGTKLVYLDAGKTLEYSQQQAKDFYRNNLR